MYTEIWISQQTISKCVKLESLMKHNVFYQTLKKLKLAFNPGFALSYTDVNPK